MTVHFSDERDVSLFAEDLYVQEVRWIQKLSPEEEKRLLEQIARGKAERLKATPNQWRLNIAKHARDCLVESYQPLVMYSARRWMRRLYARRIQGMELLDLVQEGNIGLLWAIEEYDITKGFTSLAGLAKCCIRNMIVAALADRGYMVRIPRRVQEHLNKMQMVETELSVQLGREPTRKEVACAMGVTEEKLEEWVWIGERGVVASLNVLLTEEEEAIDKLSFVSLYEAATEEHDRRQVQLMAMVAQMMETALTERQREALVLRYGLDSGGSEGRTQSEVAALMGVKPSVAQTHEIRAKANLRRVLEPLYAIAQEELTA